MTFPVFTHIAPPTWIPVDSITDILTLYWIICKTCMIAFIKHSWYIDYIIAMGTYLVNNRLPIVSYLSECRAFVKHKPPISIVIFFLMAIEINRLICKFKQYARIIFDTWMAADIAP